MNIPDIKKNIPNIISILRIAAAPVLLYLVITAHEKMFIWILLFSFISDIVDGLIARRYNLESDLGAKLDSTGDMATYICTIAGLIRFQGDFLTTYMIPIIVILSFYVLEAGYSLLKFHRISSFHTTLTRVNAYLQGIFILTLFFFGLSPLFFYVVVISSVLAYLEEIIIIAFLPEIQSNVGGLYRVLKNRSH